MSAEAERWRVVCEALRVDLEYLPSVEEAGDALLAALEARDRRIAEMEAGLREIADLHVPHLARHIARDLLAGRAAEGEYPHLDGDVTVLGPGIFASADGSVINWKGENYTPQPDPGDVVEIARCPEHGLHGDRHECFVCGGPVERVRMVPLERRAAGGEG